jgi:hypothetical protein
LCHVFHIHILTYSCIYIHIHTHTHTKHSLLAAVVAASKQGAQEDAGAKQMNGFGKTRENGEEEEEGEKGFI